MDLWLPLPLRALFCLPYSSFSFLSPSFSFLALLLTPARCPATLRACRFNGDHSQIRNALSIENTLTGYVFLVDRENRVRWKGSGTAEEVELEELKEVLMQLEQDGELGKGHRGKGGRSRRGQRRRS